MCVGKNSAWYIIRQHFIATSGAPTILAEQGINHIARYGTQCFGLCPLCFYVVQHKICQSTQLLAKVFLNTPHPTLSIWRKEKGLAQEVYYGMAGKAHIWSIKTLTAHK